MVQNQAYLFIVFSLTGVIIGCLFDFFRVLRKNIKTVDIITYIEDILFWILTGILILYNIWFFNNGEIRIYMFLGIIIGVTIYISILSNLYILFLTSIFNIIKKILNSISKIFSNFFKNFKKIKVKKGKIVKNGE